MTLLFGAHDIELNNAVALAGYLAENYSGSIFGIGSSLKSPS